MADLDQPQLDAVPPDVAPGGPPRGDGDAGFDNELVGVGFHGDLGRLAGVGQAALDLLPADHDRPAAGDSPGDGERFGQAGRLDCPGPGPGCGQAGQVAGVKPGRQGS